MLKGLKTFIIAILVAVFGALEAFDFTQFLDGQTAGYVTMVIGVVMFVLRGITTTPPLQKK